MFVKVLKSFSRGSNRLNRGDVVDFPDAVAKILISDLVAEETDPPAPASKTDAGKATKTPAAHKPSL